MSDVQHVGLVKAARIVGRATSVIARLAMEGELPYERTQDGRFVFPRAKVEELAGTLGPPRRHKRRQQTGA
jgi:hypothetical protein